MAIKVFKAELKNVADASGLETAINQGVFSADEIIAVIGKTEGNGGVNDFTRILLIKHSVLCFLIVAAVIGVN